MKNKNEYNGCNMNSIFDQYRLQLDLLYAMVWLNIYRYTGHKLADKINRMAAY